MVARARPYGVQFTESARLQEQAGRVLGPEPMPTDDTRTKEGIASETSLRDPSRRDFLGLMTPTVLLTFEGRSERRGIPGNAAAEVTAEYIDPARRELIGKQADPQTAIRRLETAIIRLRKEVARSRRSLHRPQTPSEEGPSDDSPGPTFSVSPNFERQIRAQYHRYLIQTDQEERDDFREFLDDLVTLEDDPSRGLIISFEG